jgi:hypothetical protein
MKIFFSSALFGILDLRVCDGLSYLIFGVFYSHVYVILRIMS